jgi:hypothetical protein
MENEEYEFVVPLKCGDCKFHRCVKVAECTYRHYCVKDPKCLRQININDRICDDFLDGDFA